MFKKCYPLMLLLATFSTLFISCKKEESTPGAGGSAAKLKGTYDFVGISFRGTDTQISDMDGDVWKTIVTTSYDSKNNKGTTIIDGSTVRNDKYSYRMEATSLVKVYFNDEFEEEETQQTNANAPEASNVSTYSYKAPDSLFLTTSGSGEVAAIKFSWAGDTLVLKQELSRTIINGTDRLVSNITTFTKLKKR